MIMAQDRSARLKRNAGEGFSDLILITHDGTPLIQVAGQFSLTVGLDHLAFQVAVKDQLTRCV